jgi:hypothetical protein
MIKRKRERKFIYLFITIAVMEARHMFAKGKAEEVEKVMVCW